MSLRLPVFPNWYPYNDMLLDGHLKVGRHHVKTRSYYWDYRGPVLLYTSGRVAWPCVNVYEYPRRDRPHRLVTGVATLVDVRPLTAREEVKMECNFNNITLKQFKDGTGVIQISPYPFGYFFTNVRRFEKPVPFSWPAGPVKPIFTQVAARSELGRHLKSAGIKV